FFQAEDGIRDRTVTGVQTCALPISRGPADTAADRRTLHKRGGVAVTTHRRQGRRRGAERMTKTMLTLHVNGERQTVAAEPHHTRSEERRVGKECRARWASCHVNSKW